jgi:hypothetical protein
LGHQRFVLLIKTGPGQRDGLERNPRSRSLPFDHCPCSLFNCPWREALLSQVMRSCEVGRAATVAAQAQFHDD